MNDLVEHFGTLIAAFGFMVSLNVGLVGYLFRSFRQELRDLSAKLDNTVTQPQCQNRHDEMLRFIGMLFGCKTCQEGKDK